MRPTAHETRQEDSLTRGMSTTMSYETIELTVEEPLAVLRLNRPEKLNAINIRMMEEIQLALEAVHDDTRVRAILMLGNGRAFSAGFDSEESFDVFEGMSAADVMDDCDHYTEWYRRIWSYPKPTVAAVHGYCVAGACELALICDLTIAADNTRFGEPEIRYPTGTPTPILTWVVGAKAAKELLFSGVLIDADRALVLGMVNRVVPLDELERRARAQALLIAQVSPRAVSLQKEVINGTLEIMGFLASMRLNSKLCGVLDATPTPELAKFLEIREADGITAAMKWRNDRFAELEEQC